MKLRVTFLLALAATVPASASPLNVLAFGQSNMEGFFGPAVGYDSPDERIRVWDWRQDKWRLAKLGVAPFHRAKGSSEPANNLAYVFARLLAQQCDVGVNLTFLAAGGMRIEYFMPPELLAERGWVNTQESKAFGTSLSDELLSPAGDAAMALRATGAYRYDAVLIHQGEANSLKDGDTAEVYAGKLRALLAEMTWRGLIDPRTPVILGTINGAYPRARDHARAVESLV